MATDDDTAAHVHHSAYSIFAVIADLLTAVMLCVARSLQYYRGPGSDLTPTALGNRRRQPIPPT